MKVSAVQPRRVSFGTRADFRKGPFKHFFSAEIGVTVELAPLEFWKYNCRGFEIASVGEGEGEFACFAGFFSRRFAKVYLRGTTLF